MSWADRARASTAQSGTRNGARRRYVAPPWYRVDVRRHAWRDVRKHPWRARSWLFLAPTAPRRHPLPLLRGPLHLWLRLGWMRSSPLLGRRPPAGRRLRRSRRTPGSRLPCTAWWYVPGRSCARAASSAAVPSSPGLCVRLQGQMVDVGLIDGSVYSGIFHTANMEDPKGLGVVLSMARVTVGPRVPPVCWHRRTTQL